MASKFAGIQASYAGRQVNLASGQPYLVNGLRVTLDPEATFSLGSAYRNPKRNVAAGSVHPFDSHHVWGSAFDITPPAVTTGWITDASGTKTSIVLDLHKHVYPTLRAAALTVVPTAITENGAVQVPVGDPTENHVHAQW